MTESKSYLNFFKENILIIFLPALFILALSYYYQETKPEIYIIRRLTEIPYQDNQIDQAITLVDQAVTIARSDNLQSDLNITNGQVKLFKPGPLAVNIESFSQSLPTAKSNLDKITSYLQAKYQLKIIGQDNISLQKQQPVLLLLFGFFAGLTVGLVVSLAKTYFKYF